MEIKALAPWFGGKRTLADDIIAEIGPHTQYFEPFCGAMSVLLAKKPSQKETANDLHGNLTCLARVIKDIDSAERLYARLQTVVMAEGILKESFIHLESEDEIPDIGVTPEMEDRAYWYFIASWMGRNGISGTKRQESQISNRWTNGGGSPTVRFKNAVNSIPPWHRRLLNVVIMNRDAFNILDRFEDAAGTAIYVDPPYFRSTRPGSKSDWGCYLHDFPKGDDSPHHRLKEMLSEYKKARIVISYYDCEEVREMYDGWTFIEKTRLKYLAVTNRLIKKASEAPEILIINGPSLTTENVLF